MEQYIIATDSRGAHLSDFIHDSPVFKPNNTHLIIKPGAKIEHLQRHVTNKISYLKQSLPCSSSIIFYVTIAAGICNLTEKKNHSGGSELVYLQNSVKIDTLKSTITDHYTSNSSTIKFKYVHVASACIAKYNAFNTSRGKLTSTTFSEHDTASQQKQLE